MNPAKILFPVLVLFSVNLVAAESTAVKPSSASQKPEKSQPGAHRNPHSTGTYSWQNCVEDYMKEGGLSQEKAYAKCEKMH